jgi:hypothetical protein
MHPLLLPLLLPHHLLHPPVLPAGKKGVVSVKTSLRSIVLGDVLSQRTLQKYKGKKIPEHLHTD